MTTTDFAGRDRRWPSVRPRLRTFFKTPPCDDLGRLTADVAFVGVPYDQGTYIRPGARFGPDAIRDVERIYDYVDPWEFKEAQGYFDVDAGCAEILRGVTMADCGNINVLPADVEGTFAKVTEVVSHILERGAFPLVVGGDHSITFPSVRAFSRFTPLDVVHFDAHQDFTHDIQGIRYGHGSPIRRVRELPFVRHITSIGVRKFRKVVYEESLALGVKTITTDQFKSMGAERVAQEAPGGGPIYVTLDIDVLDPSQAPGTGVPQAGGLSYSEVRDALRALSHRGKIVGFDIVEVAPPYDWAQITSLTAAQLIIDLLSAVFPPKTVSDRGAAARVQEQARP